ncbi:MAG: PH domain-containing protein [Ginsengibacter sp.]
MKSPPKISSIDLSIPQRQAPMGIIVEIIFALRNSMKALWALVIYWIVNIKKFGLLNISLGLLALLVVISIVGYLMYRHFLFYIDEEHEEFILEKGIFNKEKILLQFSKIQQVNINQSFIQRFINVYEVEIETAGSAKNEVKIKAVTKQTAEYLQKRLLEAKPNQVVLNSEDSTEPSLHETVLEAPIKISILSLIKIALTSDYIKSLLLILAFFATIYNNLKDIFYKETEMENEFVEYVSSLSGSQYLILIMATIILLVVLFNLLRFLIVYFDFTIRKKGQSMQFSYGLLNTKNTTIQLSKVQVVKLVTNFFQRKLNLTRMFISQTSSNIHSDKKATLQLPGFSKEEAEKIIQLLFGAQPIKGIVVKPTIRKVFASVNKFILVPVVIAFVFFWIEGSWLPFIIGLPIYLVIVSVLIYFSYLNNRLYVHEKFIILKSGIWDIQTEIIEPYKIQAITTRQFYWHEKSNVGHVTLHTAGGDLKFKFGDFATIKKYTNYWLYQVETSEKEWM